MPTIKSALKTLVLWFCMLAITAVIVVMSSDLLVRWSGIDGQAEMLLIVVLTAATMGLCNIIRCAVTAYLAQRRSGHSSDAVAASVRAANEMRDVTPYMKVLNEQLEGSVREAEKSVLILIDSITSIHSMSDQQMKRISDAEQNGAELSAVIEEKIMVDRQIGEILEMFVIRQEQDIAANLQRIERLQEVKSLEPLIEVISMVAHQTNYLSINAAVLAAHAGEAGRAFAVLAAEIRQLSKRTAEAADAIGNKIKLATSGIEQELSGINRVDDRQSAIENMRKVILDIKEMQGRFKHNSERLLGIVDGDKAGHQQLVKHLSDALGQLQLHDVMRQRVDHVQRALSELEEHLHQVADNVETQSWDTETIKSLRQRLDLQMQSYVMASQRDAHLEVLHGTSAGEASQERPKIELF